MKRLVSVRMLGFRRGEYVRYSAWSAVLIAAGLNLAGCSRGGGDFTLTSVSGAPVSLSEQRGKVVLLSFGAVG